MSRYYFHIRSPGNFLVDEIGMELPDVASARAEAEQGARDIMAEDLRAGRTFDHQSFEICDESGNLVHGFFFRDVLPLPT